MKTAMQELKDRLINIGFTNVEELIDTYIEKEKQQIIDAHCAGQEIEYTAIVTDAKQYYNEIYNEL